jgi:hypothetical protein
MPRTARHVAMDGMNRAYTHYSDLLGTAAADFNAEVRFEALARAAEIDTTQYRPVAVKIWGTPPKIVAVYAIEIRGIGALDFDALCEFVRDNPDRVRLKEFILEEDANIDAHLIEFEKKY